MSHQKSVALFSSSSSSPNTPKIFTFFSLKNTMAKFLFIIITLTLAFFISLSSSNANPNPNNSTPLTTAHSVLTHHGFPIGLLPTAVHSYTLNHTSGEFTVDLTNPCRLLLPPDNYLATYSKKVTGKIVENRIKELSGIRVRAFYQWWGITGIKISGEDLVFEVGMVSAKYPSKNFDEVPKCEGKKHSSS